jgi:uncharacterized protein YuzE
MTAREVTRKDEAMQLHYDKATDAIYLQIADEPVIESEEVRPGVVLDFDVHGNVVAVEVRRKIQREPSSSRTHDPNQLPEPTLADDLRALRDQLRAQGVKPMTIEEFDRELAERRGD